MFDDIENKDGIQTFEFNDNKNLLDDDEAVKEANLIQHDNKNKYLVLTVSLTSIGLLIYCAMVETHTLNKALNSLHNYLREMYKENSLAVLLILLGLLIINYIFLLPIQTVINIIAAFIIESSFKCWLILTIFSCISGTIVYLICQFCLKNFLTKIFKGNALYDVLSEESKKSPYKTAFMTRIILIPAGVKEYLLSLIDNPYPSFIISAFFIHGFWVLEAVLIAKGARNINDYMNKKKSWSEKTTSEKMSFFAIIGSLVLTVFILLIVGYWATKRIQARKEAQISSVKPLNQV